MRPLNLVHAETRLHIVSDAVTSAWKRRALNPFQVSRSALKTTVLVTVTTMVRNGDSTNGFGC